MEFSRQEYWSRLPCPPPGDLPDPGIKTQAFPALAGGFFTPITTWEAPYLSAASLVSPEKHPLVYMVPGTTLVVSAPDSYSHRPG